MLPSHTSNTVRKGLIEGERETNTNRTAKQWVTLRKEEV